MPARQRLKPRPRCYLRDGEAWPDGRLEPNAPAEAVLAQHVARTLKRAHGAAGRSKRHEARNAGLAPGTIENLLSGDSWSTLPTLVSLERSNDIVLWVNQRSSLKSYPCDYLAKGQTWPGGCLKAGAPPEALLAREITRKLLDRCGSRFEDHNAQHGINVDRLAAVTKIARTTIEDLLDGRIWFDLPTIARLEGRLEVSLWVNQQHQRDDYL